MAASHEPGHDAGDTQLSSLSSVESQRPLDHPMSSNNSQDTATTVDTEHVFTPPASDGNNSDGNGSSHDSNESQLLQLSHLAAAQEKMQGIETGPMSPGLSRKRTVDGMVKHTRERSSASPVRMGGHSRNTSTVSMASTTGSRISELSAELKARLSYAMVKVNNGWQSRTIDEVETLASQAASPTSSTSTINGRHGASASPQLPVSAHRFGQSTTPNGSHSHFHQRAGDASWRDSPRAIPTSSPHTGLKGIPALAPPVSIQPSLHNSHPRRNSNPRYTPTYLTHSHQGSPQTPAQPSPVHGTADNRTTLRTPVVDPILFSPHQNVREQDAIESLLFMSSPGNSANLKHTFPSSSQPVTSGRNGAVGGVASSPHRTALPSARKSLPSGRPSASQPLPQSHSHPKRVGFEKSPSTISDMDVDDTFSPSQGSVVSRSTPRRKVNGSEPSTPRARMPLSVSTGLAGAARPRPALDDVDIDLMLDRAAAGDDSSDSEGEIEIPVSTRPRQESAGLRV